ncbi:MAG: beta-phosphoglucomutase [Caldilineaceae bacterium]|nr:beta-phosphoglucomutase [Caldilineaceae bacterium]
MQVRIQAILFDLDGVITDTAEYHYLAWQRLADEEGLPFNRERNELLREVSRRASLEIILDGRVLDEATLQAWMARKNGYYQDLLQQVSPDDLLPGVAALLDEIEAAGLQAAIVSASKNALTALDRLGVTRRFAVIIAGPEDDAPSGYRRPKPCPDLFLLAAQRLNLPPAACLVVEDAASGIEGARAAGMTAVGIGPSERLATADLVVSDLAGVGLARLLAAATWHVNEAAFNAASPHHMETALTTGNGYLSTRGALEEGFPGDRQATLIHGLWDDAPIVFTELANAFDWTALELRIDGASFRLDQGEVSAYARRLDLRRGRVERRLYWRAPGGTPVELTFTRVASLADPHALVLRVTVTALEGAAEIRLRPWLNGHVENEGLLHWQELEQGNAGDAVYLTGITRHTGKRLAMAMTVTAGVNGKELAGAYADCPGAPGWDVTTRLPAGATLTLDKLVSVYTSRDTDDPVGAAERKVGEMKRMGFDAIEHSNGSAWRKFWQAADVLIEGDDDAQLAVRHALYQLRIAASATDDRVSIGAKSLSGFGYRGHAFWDTEIFVLPFFTYVQPTIARNLLMYRRRTIDGARRKAAANGFAGAQFAWESAETGDEVTPRWVPGPQGEELIRIWCGDIELHITADIAYAIRQYWKVTGDDQFMMEAGVAIVLEGALFWESRAEPDTPQPGCYSISDVIGPDEYHEHVDNNAYTNATAAWQLRFAADCLAWLTRNAPAQANALRLRLDLTDQRLTRWADIADNLVILQDPESGLIEQFAGFFNLAEVDWPAVQDRTESMQVILGIDGANEHQVLKQPDVLMLMALLPDEFSRSELQANWAYYNPRTDHSYGSSLGPAMMARVACLMGQPEVAYEHFMRAARADIFNVRGNAGDGMHIASSGGLWQALVFGFAGLRQDGDGITTSPQLPSRWRRLAFKVRIHDQWHEVDIRRSA